MLRMRGKPGLGDPAIPSKGLRVVLRTPTPSSVDCCARVRTAIGGQNTPGGENERFEGHGAHFTLVAFHG